MYRKYNLVETACQIDSMKQLQCHTVFSDDNCQNTLSELQTLIIARILPENIYQSLIVRLASTSDIICAS